jgi:hypothetical protein
MEDEAMDSNSKPAPPEPAALPAPPLAPLNAAEEPEESPFSDYWSSPLGKAALADLHEDDE